MSNRERKMPGLSGFSPSFPFQLFRQMPGGSSENVPYADTSPVFDVPHFPPVERMPDGSPLYLQQPQPPLTTIPRDENGVGRSYSVHDINRIYDNYRYGDAVHLPCIAGADDVVLPGAGSIRVLCVIQNQSVNDVYFAFGCDATLANGVSLGIRLAAGGTGFYDAFVPQNDLHLFSAVAGSFVLVQFAMKQAPP